MAIFIFSFDSSYCCYCTLYRCTTYLNSYCKQSLGSWKRYSDGSLFRLRIQTTFWNTRREQISHITIRSKFFFLFIGREPTTWPANNCLQIMVCSCAMPSNCVWLQIIFCTCVKETVLFSFLRSLLRENGRSLRLPRIFILKKTIQTRWSNDKTIIELGYGKISWKIKSRYFAQPCPIIEQANNHHANNVNL